MRQYGPRRRTKWSEFRYRGYPWSNQIYTSQHRIEFVHKLDRAALKNQGSTMKKTSGGLVLLAVLSFGVSSSGVFAMDKWKSTLECAQQAVEAAAQAAAAVTVVQGRIDKLESTVALLSDGLGTGRILAMIEVKNGAVVYSSAGVTFDSGTGKITFQHKTKAKPVPVY